MIRPTTTTAITVLSPAITMGIVGVSQLATGYTAAAVITLAFGAIWLVMTWDWRRRALRAIQRARDKHQQREARLSGGGDAQPPARSAGDL